MRNKKINIMAKPKIGIIIDWHQSGGYSKHQHFALRTHYVEMIKLAGGVPWLIPYCVQKNIDDYINNIDGLLVPGGFYKTPNDYYIDNNDISPYQATPRFIFEESMIKKSLDINIPILGICAGMQVMCAILGCKLTGNIANYLNGNIDHFGYVKDHNITISDDNLLKKIIKKKVIKVNSNHNEAVVKINDLVKICARSDDGCIEAIEVKNKKFALGIQWHPDFSCYNSKQITKYNPDYEIIKEFITSCK